MTCCRHCGDNCPGAKPSRLTLHHTEDFRTNAHGHVEAARWLDAGHKFHAIWRDGHCPMCNGYSNGDKWMTPPAAPSTAATEGGLW